MKKWLLIYDIKNAKRIIKVMKVVSQYATRVQLSIYELEADDIFIDNLIITLEKIIKEKDSIIFFNLCADDWGKREKFGLVEGLKQEEDYYIL